MSNINSSISKLFGNLSNSSNANDIAASLSGFSAKSKAKEWNSLVKRNDIAGMNKFKEELPASMRGYFNASNGTKVSPTELKGYTRGISDSAKEAGTSLKTASIGAKLLQGALTGLATVGIAFAFQSILTAVDNFIHRLDIQKAKLAESQTAYNNAAQVLESLNSELDATSQRINELSGKKNLSVMDQHELDKLREANALLLEQQALASTVKTEKAEAASKELKKTFDMEYGRFSSVDTSYLDINLGTSPHFDEIQEIIPALNDIDKRIAETSEDDTVALEGLQKTRTQLLENLRNTDWADSLLTLADYEKSILDTAPTEAELSAENKVFLGDIRSLRNDLWGYMSPEELTNFQISSILNEKEFDGIKDRILEIVSATGSINIDQLNTEEFSDLVKACEEAGISVTQLGDYFNEIAPNISAAQLQLKKFSKISDQVSRVISSQQLTASAMEEQGFDGSLSLETYEALIAADIRYSDCLERTADGIRLNTEEVQKLNAARQQENLLYRKQRLRAIT